MPVPSLNIIGLPRLPKWGAARGAVFSGSRNATIVCLGDSTTAGAGATAGYANAASVAYPTVLASALKGVGVNANSQAVIGSGNWTLSGGVMFDVTDTRISSGGFVDTGYQSFAGELQGAAGPSAPWSFTPSAPVDTFDFFYLTNWGQGTININVDSGSPMTLNCNPGPSLQKATISAGATGTHTLNVQCVAGQTFILGAAGYIAGAKEVTVINGGACGWTAESWNTSSGFGHFYDPLDVLKFLRPDLTIIDLTINDWCGNTPLSIYQINVQAVISAAQLSGDVLLVTGAPSAPAVCGVITQKIYMQVYAAMAAANDVTMLQPFAGGYSEVQALGMGCGDGKHLNAAGYAAYASLIASQIALS